MPVRAIIFDLDETLIRDDDATQAALRATAALAEPRGAQAETLAQAAFLRAMDGWRRAPGRDYFASIGISAGECLWGRFIGEDERLRPIARWAVDYQLETWRLALADNGLTDEVLAATLAERFRVERRARRDWLFAETRAVLDQLRGAYPLALLTNGASDIQRDKLAGSGLEGYFSASIVSGEVGVGKPDPSIFAQTLTALEVAPEDAVMVGDNPASDILGANRAGIRAIWIRREARALTHGAQPDATITSLTELAALL